jgi:hypothetical protein
MAQRDSAPRSALMESPAVRDASPAARRWLAAVLAGDRASGTVREEPARRPEKQRRKLARFRT